MASREGWPGLFWSAFKNSRNPMVLVDEHRNVVEINGAHIKLSGYPRKDMIGRPAQRFVAGGPAYSPEEWSAAIASGDFTGNATLACADGSEVMVQYAAHPERITGRRLVLLVALSTSRWGPHLRRETHVGPEEPLTAREREIAALVAAGATGPEIAEQLQISHETVRTHVRNAMIKVGARSRAQLVAKALGNGHALG